MKYLRTTLIIAATFLGVLTIISCTSNLDRKVSDENVTKYVNEICLELEASQCENFRTRVKQILMLSEFESKGHALIISVYGEKYEYLTFRDVLNKTLKMNE